MSTPHTDQTKSEAEPEAQSESTPPTQAGVPPPTPPRLAVVFGDVTIDWNIGRLRSARQTGRSWNSEDLIRVYMQPGGAALLSELIRELAARPEVPGPPFEVLPQCENLKECVRPDSAEYNHSYANWELHKYREGQKGDGEDINSWRVKDFIGLKSVTHSDFKAFESAGEGQAKLWKEAADAIEAASAKTDGRAPDVALVVLDDAGLGFRDWGEGYWTKLRHVLVDEPEGEAGAGRQKPWVVLKMARPVADLKNNKLWEFLVEKAASRLITVVTINDLRLTEGARVSRELSWELTAQNLARELTHNEVLESLSLSRYTIVSFDTAGAFVLSRHPGEKPSDGQKARAPCPTCGLFFDPQSIEGSWAEQYPGGVIGYTS
ncbi:MAG TPA: hypothetical protein VGV38_05595, partial [Pyrinomonadaceae bacterium]|nr:hypothetical protein [Pyrinomonadaceae bacterium]